MGLQTSRKYVLIFLVVILLLMYMLGLMTISEDEEVKAYEEFLKNSDLQRQKREQKATIKRRQTDTNDQPISSQEHKKPADWDVQFISGKDMVKIVDGEHKQIQIHSISIENVADLDSLVQCRDPFSKFSTIIPSAGIYEFSVTDIFHRRHYWCTAHFGKLVYNFVAYGEGAPRDNNHISLKKEGAFINGKDVTQRKEEAIVTNK